MIQIASVALVGTLLAIAVKAWNPEYSIYITLVTVLAVLFMIMPAFEQILSFFNGFYSETTQIKTYMKILFKVLAIAYITDFTGQLCRDASENSIAMKLELAGKVMIFYVSMPVFSAIISTVNELL